jgi:ATP-binding cassette subfamily B protein
MMMMRSFQRDASVVGQKLAPGTVRRIGRFASPYKRDLLVFLAIIVVDALVAVANPLIFKQVIDKGIGPNPPATGSSRVVLAMALLLVGLALFDAVLGLAMRWYSARIGEGLIYDMRSQVYAHVQRQPLAFFTRT